MGFRPGLGPPHRRLHRLLRAGPPGGSHLPAALRSSDQGPGIGTLLVVHTLGRSAHASLRPGFPAPEAAARAPHAPPAGLTLRPRTPVPGGAGGLGSCPAQTGAKQADGHVREGGRGLEASSAVSQQGHPLRPSPSAASAVARFRAGKRRRGLGRLVGERVGSWSRRAAGPVALGVPRARSRRASRREGWRRKEGAGVRAAASQAS